MRTFWRILLAAVALVAVAALGFVGWIVFGPGPTDFAGRDRVALSDYKLADPTGVPASLKDASLIERGRYLIRAADCEACHTAIGGTAFRRGPGVRPALRHDLLDQHHARQGHWASASTPTRIFSRRSIAASGVTARRFTPRCPSPVTPI